MEIFLGWFAFSVVVGIVAGARGRNGFGYFVLSMLLSPVLIGILVIASPAVRETIPGEEVPTPQTHVRCPACRELVRADARKCKHCGTALIPQQIA
jgi:hypothetical protein